MRYLLAIFAATIIAASMDACETDKAKRAALTVMSAQNDTLFLARNDFDTLGGETQEMREIIERIKERRARSENWKIEKNKYGVLHLVEAHESVDTLFYPGQSIASDSSLKVKLVAGRWEVESTLPVRIKLKDGYLENNGDSVVAGFSFVETAGDFDKLIEMVKAKKRRGESWFVGSPLTPTQHDHLQMFMGDDADSSRGDQSVTIVGYGPLGRDIHEVVKEAFGVIDSLEKKP